MHDPTVLPESDPCSVGTPGMITGFDKSLFTLISVGGCCASTSAPLPVVQDEQPTDTEQIKHESQSPELTQQCSESDALCDGMAIAGWRAAVKPWPCWPIATGCIILYI